MRRPEHFSIVLARVEDEMQPTGEWTKEYGDGVNYVAKLRPTPAVKAAMWLHDASERDIPGARAFAASEGYVVVLVPRTERHPLAYAKRKVLKG